MLGGREKLPDKSSLLKPETDSRTSSLLDDVESGIESDINKLVKPKDTQSLGNETKTETQKPFSVTSEMLLSAYPNNLFYSNGDKHYKTPYIDYTFIYERRTVI